MDAHSSGVTYADWTARRPKPFALRVERLQWREHRLIVAAALHSTLGIVATAQRKLRLIKGVGISVAFCASKVLRVNGIEASMWCTAWHCGVV